MNYDAFTYFAWFVLALLFFVVVAIIVWLGSQPKKIAQRRNHPQVDAINACSWIGLLLGGVGWPIAFIWAFLKSGPVDFDSRRPSETFVDALSEENIRLKERIAELEKNSKSNDVGEKE